MQLLIVKQIKNLNYVRYTQNYLEMQEYFTLDNRDCPFKVTIENNDIKIYKYKNNRLLYSFTNVYQYFVAESPWTKSSYTDASYVGNCILIRPTNKLKYYLVSDSIYKFKTDIKIENFISQIGNNLVPYPYAIAKNKIYLFLENVYFDESDNKLLEDYKSGEYSPYDKYYNGIDMNLIDVYYRQYSIFHPEFAGANLVMFYEACVNNDKNLICELIEEDKKKYMSYGNYIYDYCYEVACQEGNMELIEYLEQLYHHFDYNVGLIAACESGHFNVINRMLSKGAHNYNYALFAACEGGHTEIANLMIDLGANDFNKALHRACINNHIELAKLIISKGANKYEYLRIRPSLEFIKLYNKLSTNKLDIKKYVIKDHKLYRLLNIVDSNLLRIVNKYI